MAVQVVCGECRFPLTKSGGYIQDCPWCHTQNEVPPNLISTASGSFGKTLLIGVLLVGLVVMAFGRKET